MTHKLQSSNNLLKVGQFPYTREAKLSDEPIELCRDTETNYWSSRSCNMKEPKRHVTYAWLEEAKETRMHECRTINLSAHRCC
jgi:hypothetical protein